MMIFVEFDQYRYHKLSPDLFWAHVTDDEVAHLLGVPAPFPGNPADVVRVVPFCLMASEETELMNRLECLQPEATKQQHLRIWSWARSKSIDLTREVMYILPDKQFDVFRHEVGQRALWCHVTTPENREPNLNVFIDSLEEYVPPNPVPIISDLFRASPLTDPIVTDDNMEFATSTGFQELLENPNMEMKLFEATNNVGNQIAKPEPVSLPTGDPVQLLVFWLYAEEDRFWTPRVDDPLALNHFPLRRFRSNQSVQRNNVLSWDLSSSSMIVKTLTLGREILMSLRQSPNAFFPRDPSLISKGCRVFAHLPGGCIDAILQFGIVEGDAGAWSWACKVLYDEAIRIPCDIQQIHSVLWISVRETDEIHIIRGQSMIWVEDQGIQEPGNTGATLRNMPLYMQHVNPVYAAYPSIYVPQGHRNTNISQINGPPKLPSETTKEDGSIGMKTAKFETGIDTGGGTGGGYTGKSKEMELTANALTVFSKQHFWDLFHRTVLIEDEAMQLWLEYSKRKLKGRPGSTFKELWWCATLICKRATERFEAMWSVLKTQSTIDVVNDTGDRVCIRNMFENSELPSTVHVKKLFNQGILIHCNKHQLLFKKFSLGDNTVLAMRKFHKHCSKVSERHPDLMKQWVEKGLPVTQLGEINARWKDVHQRVFAVKSTRNGEAPGYKVKACTSPAQHVDLDGVSSEEILLGVDTWATLLECMSTLEDEHVDAAA